MPARANSALSESRLPAKRPYNTAMNDSRTARKRIAYHHCTGLPPRPSEPLTSRRRLCPPDLDYLSWTPLQAGDVCWICLGSSNESAPLCQPCRCPRCAHAILAFEPAPPAFCALLCLYPSGQHTTHLLQLHAGARTPSAWRAGSCSRRVAGAGAGCACGGSLPSPHSGAPSLKTPHPPFPRCCSKETHCEFCDQLLPDWKATLTPPCGAQVCAGARHSPARPCPPPPARPPAASAPNSAPLLVCTGTCGDERQL